MGTQVLQVNSAGQPLGLIDWMKAVSKLWNGKAVLVQGDEKRMLCSASWSTPQPLIIQIDHYVKLRPMHDRDVVKQVVFARDNWCCQYCGVQVTESSGSIDHVRPRRAFKAEGRPPSDAHTWDNVVTACKPCNNEKADRTPLQAGMMPLTTPKKPDYVQTYWAGKSYHPIQAQYVADYFRVDPQTLLGRRFSPKHKQ